MAFTIPLCEGGINLLSCISMLLVQTWHSLKRLVFKLKGSLFVKYLNFDGGETVLCV